MTGVSVAARRGLSAHQQKSLKATRRRLEHALERLLEGKQKIVKKGARLGVAAVCEEAGGVERSTLYRYHEPVLRAIERAKKKKIAQVAGTQLGVNEKQAKAKREDYRAIAEQAQMETAALARINYRLQARVTELEEMLRQRDVVIKEMPGRVSRVK